MDYKEIHIQELFLNPFERLAKDWMVVSAFKNGKLNALTASWGGLGIYCNKPVANLYIRPQRLTCEHIIESKKFTLTFFKEHRKALWFLGSVSGHDNPDKMKQSNLTIMDIDGEPTYAEGDLMLVCKLIYQQHMTPEGFIEKNLIDEHYKNHDFHNIFIGEIVKAYSKTQ